MPTLLRLFGNRLFYLYVYINTDKICYLLMKSIRKKEYDIEKKNCHKNYSRFHCFKIYVFRTCFQQYINRSEELLPCSDFQNEAKKMN